MERRIVREKKTTCGQAQPRDCETPKRGEGSETWKKVRRGQKDNIEKRREGKEGKCPLKRQL